jgi:hypothetical protein
MVNIPPSWLIMGRAAEPPNFLQQRPRRLVLTDEGHGETNNLRICSGYIYILYYIHWIKYVYHIHTYIHYITLHYITYIHKYIYTYINIHLKKHCVYIYMYVYVFIDLFLILGNNQSCYATFCWIEFKLVHIYAYNNNYDNNNNICM